MIEAAELTAAGHACLHFMFFNSAISLVSLNNVVGLGVDSRAATEAGSCCNSRQPRPPVLAIPTLPELVAVFNRVETGRNHCMQGPRWCRGKAGAEHNRSGFSKLAHHCSNRHTSCTAKVVVTRSLLGMCYGMCSVCDAFADSARPLHW